MTSPLKSVKTQLTKTTNQMQENMQLTIDRQADLDNILNKSSTLHESSLKFTDRSTSLKWSGITSYVYGAVVCAVVIILGISKR